MGIYNISITITTLMILWLEEVRIRLLIWEVIIVEILRNNYAIHNHFLTATTTTIIKTIIMFVVVALIGHSLDRTTTTTTTATTSGAIIPVLIPRTTTTTTEFIRLIPINHILSTG